MPAVKPDQMSDEQLLGRQRKLSIILRVGIGLWIAVIVAVVIMAQLKGSSPKLVTFFILGFLTMIPVNNERKAAKAELERRGAAKQV